MNTFRWRTTHNILDLTSIMHIENAVDKTVRSKIKNEILNYKENISDNSGSEKNCWRGHINENYFSVDTQKFLKQIILKGYEHFINELVLPTNLYTSSTNFDSFDLSEPQIHFWFNVNSKNGYNISHNHGGAFISGVLYIQSSETGSIEFEPLNYIYKINHPAWFYNGTAKYDPQDGDMILFPSYLMHRVEPNPSDKERINVAFNIGFNRK